MMLSIDLDTALQDAIQVNGEHLHALATLILTRVPFLRHVLRRQRTIRTDPRVLALGVGVSADAQALLDSNLNLVAYLLREAARNGNGTEETYSALADCLYELRQYQAALAVVEDANRRAIASTRLDKVRSRALLALGDELTFAQVTAKSGTPAVDTRRIGVTDHRLFDDWARKIRGDLITISDLNITATGHYRFLVNGALHDFAHTFTSSPLRGVKKRDLKVYGGFLPFHGREGYYHTEALVTVNDAPLTVEVARNAFAFDAAKCRTLEFRGKYLVPCSPHRYFGQYSHGIVQIYGRLIAALQTGMFDDYGILLPESTPDWVLTLLSRAGVAIDRIQKMPLDAISDVEEACVLPMNWEVCPSEIQALRHAIGNEFAVGGERVNYYLTRNNVKNFHRALENEDEFIAICRSRGFTILDPIDYSLDEQIALFSKAGTIVTSDSSGDTNMIYAPPGAEVVIIIPGRFCGMLMADVAIACGHTMSVIIGEFLAGDRNVDHSHGPYRADPEMLRNLLDTLERRAGP